MLIVNVCVCVCACVCVCVCVCVILRAGLELRRKTSGTSDDVSPAVNHPAEE